MDIINKDKLIEDKYRSLSQPADFNERWKMERSARYQLLSVSSLLIKEMGGDLARIENWCLEQGFDGMEIRIQDFIGFTGATELSALKGIKTQGLLTVHLSDWASWIPFFLGDQDRLRRTFYQPENISAYFSGDQPNVLIDRLARELDIAGELNARVATWHANQIDYDEILFNDSKYSDQEIIAVVSQAVERLLARNSGYADILSLENGSAIDRGVRCLADFRPIFSNPAFSDVGVTFDTAHRTAVLSQESGGSTGPTDRTIPRELADNPDIVRRIKAVHLSDSLTTREFSKEASADQLKKASQDFWYKRDLVRDVVIDDHVPVGFVFKSAKAVLDAISATRTEKLCIVWELRPGSLESLKRSIQIQRFNILYDEERSEK